MTRQCEGCQTGEPLDFEFSMAFQPIVDTADNRIWGYEALVRGRSGEGAPSILSRVRPDQKYKFDQACRVKAIELAARLYPRDGKLPKLSINFLPNAVYEPAACLRATLAAARKSDFPRDAIMFEFTENETVRDTSHLQAIITEYRRQGFTTALDDFGAGFAGLGLLADFQPDLIKLDMDLVRGVEGSRARQVIIAGIMHIARELDITVLAEGVETEAEFTVLKSAGITLFQGYLFARPSFETLPGIGGAFGGAFRSAA
ncbi:EAL domain-containing protein [Aquibium oceanicum]|uniref:Diguanylate phosphodiesterase n=1 Tax=Aquibium oceanicum TaxID=1670800 RepID=A0A1L3SVK5_9HYPH|nr:EAL domain-containing protein [Aquibium oceanicum]APH73457.1 diguanylate phosphodiesterase [Aquibium oceanicum]